MTFRIIFLFFFLTIPLVLFSQQEKNMTVLKKRIKTKSDKFIGEPNFNKAQSFFLHKEWDSTLVYAMRQISASIKNKELTNYCLFFRAYSFQQKKIFKEAEKEFSKISNDFTFYDHTKMFLGEIALEQGVFPKALSYFLDLEKLNVNKNLGLNQASIEFNLGICYSHLKKFDKAEIYLLKSTRAQEPEKDTLKLIGMYVNIANLYYEQYKDRQAIPYFKKAYDLGKHIKDYSLKGVTAKNMAVVEENRKDFAKALSYRKEYEKWKDSLNDQNEIYEVAQIEKKIAVEKKQEEVKVLQAENKVKEEQKKVYLYSGVFLLLLLGVSFYSYKEKVKTTKIITAQKENLDALNATKDKLFSIVSHDLRSSVHALKTSNSALSESLVTKNFNMLDGLLQTNSAIVNGAYNLLDNLLHWALLQTKQSYFEIASMRLFFIVEQVAHNYKPLLLEKNISFENKVLKSDVIYADQESLKIILRNLVDNAIKFSNQNGAIKIYTRNKGMYIELVVEDSGLGMDEITRLELLKDTVLLSKKKNDGTIGTGLGLQLCKSMLQKNHGKLAIESELEKGTKMIVSLPKTLQNG